MSDKRSIEEITASIYEHLAEAERLEALYQEQLAQFRSMAEDFGEFLDTLKAEQAEGEAECQTLDDLGIVELDCCEETGEALYSVPTLYDTITVLVDSEGTEWYNSDWQGHQPQSIDEVADGCWEWCRGEDMRFFYAPLAQPRAAIAAV